METRVYKNYKNQTLLTIKQSINNNHLPCVDSREMWKSKVMNVLPLMMVMIAREPRR